MKRWQADLLLLGVALIWGVTFVVQSTAMRHIGPLAFTGLRFLIGAAVVAPLAWREFAALAGYALMGDRLDAVAWSGAALILVCILAVQLAPQREAIREAAA